MRNLDSYRITMLALVMGLFTALAAQAQARPDLLGPTSTSSPTFAANTIVSPSAASEPAAARPTLLLSQPPAPESLASFYDGSHKDLHQSLAWIQEANAVAPTYWNLYAEARIRLQLQDYAGAGATAEQAQQLALRAAPVGQEYATLSAAVAAKARELAKR